MKTKGTGEKEKGVAIWGEEEEEEVVVAVGYTHRSQKPRWNKRVRRKSIEKFINGE